MLILRHDWNLRSWYDFLIDECDLQIGKDFCWAWKDNCWAIEFDDPKVELMVILKTNCNDS